MRNSGLNVRQIHFFNLRMDFVMLVPSPFYAFLCSLSYKHLIGGILVYSHALVTVGPAFCITCPLPSWSPSDVFVLLICMSTIICFWSTISFLVLSLLVLFAKIYYLSPAPLVLSYFPVVIPSVCSLPNYFIFFSPCVLLSSSLPEIVKLSSYILCCLRQTVLYSKSLCRVHVLYLSSNITGC